MLTNIKNIWLFSMHITDIAGCNSNLRKKIGRSTEGAYFYR